MSFAKALFGFNGIDRVAKRIIVEAEQRRRKGDTSDFLVEYTQEEIGVRTSASTAASLVARQLKKAGLMIVNSDIPGGYGSSVRLLIRL